jgi:hypothetical protein
VARELSTERFIITWSRYRPSPPNAIELSTLHRQMLSAEPDLRGVTKAATLPLNVEVPNVEWERPGLDLATLQQLAAATGGQVFDMGQGASVPAAFKVAQVARTLEDRQEIWHAPLLFVTIVLALFGEWVLRKKFRMV